MVTLQNVPGWQASRESPADRRQGGQLKCHVVRAIMENGQNEALCSGCSNL